MNPRALVALRLSSTAVVAGLLAATQLLPTIGAGGDHASYRPDPRIEAVASSNQVDTRSADAVRAAYRTRWAPATDATVTSGGAATGCRAAASSSAHQRATLDAINFARGLVGQNAVTFSTKYNTAASAAALIMSANGRLSHDPPKSWKCWTKAGRDAAASSNILLDSTSPSAARLVGLYLDDPGSSNTAAGHRRWLLRPEATTMGSGNAQGEWFGNAIYLLAFDEDDRDAPAKSLYSWPAAGWFPSQLEPGGRWSISSAGNVDFSTATVRVTGPDGRAVAVTKRPYKTGYGDNTLVWDLRNPPAEVTSAAPQVYSVTVSGFTGGSISSYSYKVRLFDPTAAAK